MPTKEANYWFMSWLIINWTITWIQEYSPNIRCLLQQKKFTPYYRVHYSQFTVRVILIYWNHGVCWLQKWTAPNQRCRPIRQGGRVESHVAWRLGKRNLRTWRNWSKQLCFTLQFVFIQQAKLLAGSAFSTQAWETAALGRATLGMPDRDNNEGPPFLAAEFHFSRTTDCEASSTGLWCGKMCGAAPSWPTCGNMAKQIA